MYPSDAERFYLERQRQEEWARQEEEGARAGAAVAAQIAGRVAEISRILSQHGVQMYYEERTFDIGDIQIAAGVANRAIIVIPGEFGTALSFVATFSNAGAWHEGPESSEPKWLWWWFVTSVDGQNWLPMEPPGIKGHFVSMANTAASTRLHGPFGSRLALQIGCKASNSVDDRLWLPGKWRGLRLSIGVQRI